MAKVKKNKNKVKKTNTKAKGEHFSQFKKKWKKGNLFEKFLVLVMLGLVSGFILGIAFVVYVILNAPEFDIDKLYTQEASIIYDMNGNEISRLGTENRERVTYEELPEVFIDALVATEDSRFFQHSGVDMARFAKATIGQLLGNSNAGGASTLTMQIVKQRYTDSTASGIEGIIRKFTDMYMAVFKLEKNYTKEQIIEYYVNIPGLGSGTFGIQQASEKYFGKPVSEVTLAEAAMLAGLFQAPSAYNPYNNAELAQQRRDQVLTLMNRHGYITKEECDLAKQISVKSLLASSNGGSSNRNQGFINTVIEEVIKRTGKNPYLVSMKIYSTMDPARQESVNKIMKGESYKWEKEYLQGGIAITDVKTGAITAIGAGRNVGERTYNYATMINKHPGSTAKPIFDYGPAIEYLNWSTGQMIIDDVYTYSNGISMKNWDSQYKGIMTAKNALGSSRNIPALQTFQQLNQNQINEFVTNLGITPEYDKTGFINESHSIGGFNGTNPLQMSAAYAAFARGGTYIEPYSFTKVEFLDTGEIYTVTPEKRKAMSDSTAYMINMMLVSAVKNGYVTGGSKSGTDIASKTGTSTVSSNVKKEYGIKVNIIGDSWQIAYSPDYVYAVWIGVNKISSTEYLTNDLGGRTKKAIIRKLAEEINNKNSRFVKPSSVVTAEIELETNPLQLASENTPKNLRSTEYFKAKTVPEEKSTRFSQLANPTNLKATYVAGTNNVQLTWTGIHTPDAISETYLEEYFKNGYGRWAEKYMKQRLEYNKKNIGTLGYHVYISNGGSYTDLGFVNGTSYTYTGQITSSTTFMVKSSYSIFKSNKSSGITANIEVSSVPDVPTTPTTPTTKPADELNITTWSMEINTPQTITVAEFYTHKTNNTLIKVTGDGKDVTDKLYKKMRMSCWDDEGKETDCNTLDCKQTYSVQYSMTYNGTNKNKQIKLASGC